jgi:hypothetical protein
MEEQTPREPIIQRLSDLRGAWPMDGALRNLSGLLDRALETSARLRVFATEAVNDGLDEAAETYRRLEQLQRRQITELEIQLRHHLGAAITEGRARHQLDEEPAS